MKYNNVLRSLLLISIFSLLYSCGTDDSDNYTELPIEEESPVIMDLDAVPYNTLAEYNFFEGEIKNLNPVHKVLPYDINSGLFTDYALKKRFIWMPKDTKATYTSDSSIPVFPDGTVLIKNFYYDNTVPSTTTVILETRIMIKKPEGWIFANYVWNNDQTEATLDTNGGLTRMSWSQNGVTKNINYKIPSIIDCATCHTLNDIYSPIGVKPQNLNKMYAYNDGEQNQLSKWIETGYLDNKPETISSTVDWKDTSQPLELRVRSYLDINCAHCHAGEATSCGYTPMELSFAESSLPTNLGLCVQPSDFVTGNQQYIVAGQDVAGSLLHFRMSNTIRSEMMPPLGRVLVHDEGLELIEEWINSLETTCP
ncbi:MAG: hypothetical protein BM557_01735 [Flavobacterium sp. MedPE-SWcel]|uniref:hypothetical protein n=1 Tax=uncultured Flavobacterium sp. TaxID=165435 RepID=UPI00092058C5|nr:hypothetical protein [uncultured Flavobacterium sp.]OIQ22122.1 MAG: hypothetical protein BM557_01735 [Flavobacterium sp. MedPE-SWcel]